MREWIGQRTSRKNHALLYVCSPSFSWWLTNIICPFPCLSCVRTGFGHSGTAGSEEEGRKEVDESASGDAILQPTRPCSGMLIDNRSEVLKSAETNSGFKSRSDDTSWMKNVYSQIQCLQVQVHCMYFVVNYVAVLCSSLCAHLNYRTVPISAMDMTYWQATQGSSIVSNKVTHRFKGLCSVSETLLLSSNLGSWKEQSTSAEDWRCALSSWTPLGRK